MRTSAVTSLAVALGAAFSFTLAAAAPSATEADGAPPPVDKVIAAVKGRLWVCGLYARAALVHLDARRDAEAQSALEDLLSKIKESKENFSETYVAIRARLSGGNKDATDALNDYASSVLAAYDESAVRAGETQLTYARRAADLESELSAKADAFKRRLPESKPVATGQSPVQSSAAQRPAQVAAQPAAQAIAHPVVQVATQPPVPASAQSPAPQSVQPAQGGAQPAQAVAAQPLAQASAQPAAVAAPPLAQAAAHPPVQAATQVPVSIQVLPAPTAKVSE